MQNGGDFYEFYSARQSIRQNVFGGLWSPTMNWLVPNSVDQSKIRGFSGNVVDAGRKLRINSGSWFTETFLSFREKFQTNVGGTLAVYAFHHGEQEFDKRGDTELCEN